MMMEGTITTRTEDKYQPAMPSATAVEPKRLFHPYAEKPSPFEEWKTALILALETLF